MLRRPRLFVRRAARHQTAACLLAILLLVALAGCGPAAGAPAAGDGDPPATLATGAPSGTAAWTSLPGGVQAGPTATPAPAGLPGRVPSATGTAAEVVSTPSQTGTAGAASATQTPPATLTAAAGPSATPWPTASPAVSPSPSPPACKLFVLAGQSNMGGRGRYDALPPGDDGALPADVRLVAVSLDVHGRPLAGGLRPAVFGPELGLARSLAAALPADRLLLVKYAVDASSLLDWAPDWDPEAAALTGHPEFGPLYDDLLDLVRQAIAAGQPGHGCRPAAVLWVQGERDALYPQAAAAYEANLAALVRALRADLGAPHLPFLVGQVDPPRDRYPAAEVVRAAQAAVARTLPGVYLVDTQGLSRYDDGLHYDTAGQLALGRRFARVYLDQP